jgi:hypothetical protein
MMRPEPSDADNDIRPVSYRRVDGEVRRGRDVEAARIVICKRSIAAQAEHRGRVPIVDVWAPSGRQTSSCPPVPKRTLRSTRSRHASDTSESPANGVWRPTSTDDLDISRPSPCRANWCFWWFPGALEHRFEFDVTGAEGAVWDRHAEDTCISVPVSPGICGTGDAPCHTNHFRLVERQTR